MLQPRISTSLRRALYGSSSLCIRCQRQALNRPQFLQTRNAQRQFTSATVLHLPAESPEKSKDKKSKDEKPKEEDEPEFVPQLLGRPIGFPFPPKAGENLGIKAKKTYTGATMSERNLEKRKDIVEAWGQNYFRDFKNIRKYRSGKTFLANPRIFRSDLSLYFPNLHGETLATRTRHGDDTTLVLKGKLSVVNIYSSTWGEMQAQSFTGQKQNPALAEVLKNNKDIAQMVDINVEENTMKAWLVALFMWRLRRTKPQEDWGKYFVVRKGVSDRIRETIGMLNGRVGYVYLVDENCKIRWAGSGDAEGDEKDYLTKGLEKLIREHKSLEFQRQEKRVDLKAQREKLSQ